MTYPVPSASLKELLETTTAEYQNQLPGSPGESLLLARGITEKVQRYFRLGYVSSPISGDEMFKGRIAIPYLTPSGVVSMRFKLVDGSGDKMYPHPASPAPRPYGVPALSSKGTILVVEGEPDVWAAAVCGLPAIGIPGATNWKRLWRRLLRRWDVIIVADGDDPGRALAADLYDDLSPVANSVRRVYADPKEDLNSVLIVDGVAAVRKWLGVEDD